MVTAHFISANFHDILSTSVAGELNLKMGESAFSGAANLKSVTLPSGNKTIENGVFAVTGLTNIVTHSEGVTKTGNMLFPQAAAFGFCFILTA